MRPAARCVSNTCRRSTTRATRLLACARAAEFAIARSCVGIVVSYTPQPSAPRIQGCPFVRHSAPHGAVPQTMYRPSPTDRSIDARRPRPQTPATRPQPQPAAARPSGRRRRRRRTHMHQVLVPVDELLGVGRHGALQAAVAVAHVHGGAQVAVQVLVALALQRLKARLDAVGPCGCANVGALRKDRIEDITGEILGRAQTKPGFQACYPRTPQ